MLQPVYEKKFQRDLKRLLKRNKDLEKLDFVLNKLVRKNKLENSFLDHSLKGNYANCRECHIEPDWLLIYMIKNPHIIFIRTGTHSNLFK